MTVGAAMAFDPLPDHPDQPAGAESDATPRRLAGGPTRHAAPSTHTVREAQATLDQASHQVKVHFEEALKAWKDGDRLAGARDGSVVSLPALKQAVENLTKLREQAKKETFELGQQAIRVGQLEREAAAAQSRIEELVTAQAAHNKTTTVDGRAAPIGSPERPFEPPRARVHALA